MFNWRGFPWTNFEELNLDWVLRHIKSIEVTQIPDLAKKVDDTYQYITDNLGEIVSQLATVIYNVKWSGAMGDGVTDDSAAIADALTKGRILYFPEGTYCFKNVTSEEPLIVFGDGDKTVLQPIRKHDTSNQFYTMFSFKSSLYMSDMMFRPAAPLPSESGTKYYNEAALVCELSDHVHLERVTFDRFYEAYHIGVASPVFIDFEDRHGMAVYFHNCGEVCVDDCVFSDWGGEELVWITQDRDKFSQGVVNIRNCIIKDKQNGLSGSAINVLGGNLHFTENIINNVNNIYTGGTEGGSIFNLMGNNTVFSDNIFTECKGGNYLDFCEGYFAKADTLICSDNIFSGSFAHAIKIMARQAKISGNYIESAECFRFMTTTDAFTYTTPDGVVMTLAPYCADISNVYTAWDGYVVSDNDFKIQNAPYSLVSGGSIPANSCCISEQSQTGLAAKPKQLIISGNIFRYVATDGSNYATYNVISLYNEHNKTIIEDNAFIGAGISSPAFNSGGVAYRSTLSGNPAQDCLIYKNNVIDASDLTLATDGIACVTGTATFRTGTKYNMVFNEGLGTVLDHSGLTSSLGGFDSAYNNGITANT